MNTHTQICLRKKKGGNGVFVVDTTGHGRLTTHAPHFDYVYINVYCTAL